MLNLEIPENAYINVEVLKFITQKEKNEIKEKISKKYNIDKKNIGIKISPQKENIKNREDINKIVENVKSKEYHKMLIKNYISKYNITCDYDEIIKIDNEVNKLLPDYSNENVDTYKIKWLKWSNFLSFGEYNYINLDELKGLVLLNSNPSNQGGKTNFACDLFEFFLFGNVTSGKAKTQDRLFNDYLPDATELVVEGMIEVKGEEYIIKRVLSRPKKEKRSEKSKTTQKVYLTQIINGQEINFDEELASNNDEFLENVKCEDNNKTNQKIKDLIGEQKDFNLAILANSDNLKGLISTTDSDREQIFLRWIGLFPILEKKKISNKYYNENIKPSLLLDNDYINKKSLTNQINEYKEKNINNDNEINNIFKKIKDIEKNIEDYECNIEEIRKTTPIINEEIKTYNKETIEKEINKINEDIKIKTDTLNDTKLKYKNVLNNIETSLKELNLLGVVNEEELINLNSDLEKKEIELSNREKKYEKYKILYKELNSKLEKIQKDNICSDCGKTCPNGNFVISTLVNNREELIKEAKENTEEKNKIKKEIFDIKEKISNIEALKVKIIEKNKFLEENNFLKEKYSLTIEIIETAIIKLNNDVNAKNEILIKLNNYKFDIEVYQKNKILIESINDKIKAETKQKNDYNYLYGKLISEKENNIKEIQKSENTIKEIEKCEKIKNNWQDYLLILGDKGIAKMVIEDMIPVINEDLSLLLNDICDFEVKIKLDDKNNKISLIMERDNIENALSSGSGFEQTVSALALRSVLSKYSKIPRPSFMLFDEILGGVAEKNYDNLKKLYEKILIDYEFIFQVTHLEQITDWHDKIITINKENRISKINIEDKIS